nr:MAG TPA: hypothetical protein [Caudoviricetes sp.]
MLSYKQIKRENHIIETLTVVGLHSTQGGTSFIFKCAYTAKGRVQFLYLQSAFILTLAI